MGAFKGKMGESKCHHCGSETVSYSGIVDDHECGTMFNRLTGNHTGERPRCVEIQRDRLRDALLDVWRVLGPSVPSCVSNCQGRDHEWGEALRIIKAAFPGEVLPYEKGADDG